MEEERESLRRQIQQLQGLISRHKHMHGNAPATTAPAQPRWRNPSQPQYRPRGSFRGGAATTAYQPRQPGLSSTWRAQYSLVNRTSRGAEHNLPHPVVVPSGNPANLPNKGNAEKVTADNNTPKAATVSKVPGNLIVPNNNNNRTLAVPKAKCPPPTSTQKPLSDEAALPSTSAEWGVRLRKNSQGSSRGPCVTPLQVPQISQNLSKATRGSAGTLPPSNNLPVPFPKSAIGSPPSNVGAAKNRLVSPASSLNPPKNTLPAVTTSRVLRSSKTKYTWVAASPKTNSVVKKVSPSAKKVSAATEKVKTPTGGNIAKAKKNSPHQKCAPKNRYKWKAQPAAGTVSVPVSSSQAAVNRTAPGPQTPEMKSSHSAGSGGAASFRDSGNSSYKVKSRTKLVRRRSTSRSPVEKKAPPLPPLTVKSRYVLRRKSLPRVKSPVTVKKSSPRGLVHLSKHRLRRLPPTRPHHPAQAGTPLSSVKTPSSSRMIKTRYRIVKKISSPPLISSPWSTLNTSHYWRSRLLLANRMRQLCQARRTQPHQRWRKSLRCIEGSIYQVSANKLSKTWSPGAASKSTPKTGKADVSSVSPSTLYSSRTATPTRYFASRAVQRSLAIIRQAQQKKAKKEYCMYYNRFGRCKRGDSCPFIHDPEKVAVCTMFLRGTCKLTDGTCQFSHKISKDKMPVCSYFLKGICRRTDCPYSHVYVSRKAEVCQDFLKGYCPMGAKCKKKHTLLCPHYSRSGTCPDGTKCKLQHRQKKRRTDIPTPDPEFPPPSCKQKRKAKEDSG
ncbi:PREDICTED: zinc finger CCCH domain-containing protein 3 [Nanorana parkeri]|uniref:zinc finger CCCH domain-containing protein 3 n=1 Tax=Nanorana parkeri TaxID=125878 RepID=UPI000854F198|nr:PREDICTED: zinc finger CCCH domain-containing protein 3 [Nanorana parkeri]